MKPTWANMLAAFKSVRERAPTMHNTVEAHRGICASVRWTVSSMLETDVGSGSLFEVREEADNKTAALFKAVGYDPVCPIRDDEDDIHASAERQYDFRPHWSGRQLALRIKLLDECITYLENGNEPVV